MFSVVVPTFNSTETIGETLRSILDQTWTEFEVIVVDNFSSDSTLEVVEGFHDDRVKLIQNDNQGRPSVSRNLGISVAKYEYIAFCDSDDVWAEDKLEICAALGASGCAFICHKVSLIGPWHKRVLTRIFTRQVAKNLQEFILHGNNMVQSSVVVKRELLESVQGYSVNDSLVAIEDAHLWCKLFAQGHTVTYIEKSLGGYRYSATALSFRANQFKANRSLRFAFFRRKKPDWYKYNIAAYLARSQNFVRARLYFSSIIWSREASFELRVKSALCLVRLWSR